MLYDPDNPEYIFNEEKYMDVSGVVTQLSEKRRRLLEKKRDDPDVRITPVWVSVLVVIVFIGLIIVMATAVKTGHPAVAACIFGGIFVVGGIAVMPKTRNARELYGVKRLINGIIITLIGLSVCVPMLLIKHIGNDRAFLILAAGMFASCGLLFFIQALFNIFSTSSRYGIPVEARCTGYAHMVVNNRGSHVESAEVFEYDYEGERYESVNGAFRHAADAEIGETVTIRLNPRVPYDIFYEAPRKGRNSDYIVMAAFSSIFVIVGIILGIFAINGDIENKAQSRNANGKHILTDAVIEEKIGDSETPWNISLRTVEDKYEDDGIYYVRFSGDLLNSAAKDLWDKFELNDSYYFIRNTATEELIAVVNDKEWDYRGSHPLSDLRE